MLEIARTYRDYIVYRHRRLGIERGWQARHNKVFSLHPQYRRPCGAEVESQHLAIWRPLAAKISLDTFRVCWNISGHADPRIVPEELFASEIERVLAHRDWTPVLSHKSMYSRFFPADVFPECYFHNIEGQFFDAALNPLEGTALPHFEAFEYPVVLKPNTGSSGGKGVSFPKTPEELRSAIEGRINFVVQRRIRQDAFFESFNAYGLNTLRVYTYKSVLDDEVHVLNTALRLGKGGSLDNETAGGIVCFIRPGGRLNEFAVDRYGEKFERHPDSQLAFGPSQVVPKFEQMVDLTRTLHRLLPAIRLAGWDMCLDHEGRWRCVEVNLNSHTIRFAQYAGQPFFGDFTEEVVRYCSIHPQLRRAHVRIT